MTLPHALATLLGVAAPAVDVIVDDDDGEYPIFLRWDPVERWFLWCPGRSLGLRYYTLHKQLVEALHNALVTRDPSELHDDWLQSAYAMLSDAGLHDFAPDFEGRNESGGRIP